MQGFLRNREVHPVEKRDQDSDRKQKRCSPPPGGDAGISEISLRKNHLLSTRIILHVSEKSKASAQSKGQGVTLLSVCGKDQKLGVTEWKNLQIGWELSPERPE